MTDKNNPKTAFDFNKKYAQYLPKRWYGLEIEDEEIIQMLDFIFENYLTKIEGFIYYQIKTKFSMVRFYSCLDESEEVDIKGTLIVDLIQSNIRNILKLKELEEKLDIVPQILIKEKISE